MPPPRLRVLLDRLDAEGETVVVDPPPPWSSVPLFWVGAFVGPVVFALAVSAAISPRLPQP